MKTFEELKVLVEEWSVEKELTDPRKQLKKFSEEACEFCDACEDLLSAKKFTDDDAYIKDFKKAVQDELGDVLVTLIINAKLRSVDIVEALEGAYNKIAARKGETIDGTFVKEEDL